MSDKSEIEVIRAVKRYNPCDIKARNGFDLDSELVPAADYDRLLAHVDALEARLARLEAALENAELIYENGGSAKSMVLVISAALAQVKP